MHRTVVIEHPRYRAIREQLAQDPIVRALAEQARQIPRSEIASSDGTPTSRFMRQANFAYRVECETAGVTPIAGMHMGAVAEAILMILGADSIEGVARAPLA